MELPPHLAEISDAPRPRRNTVVAKPGSDTPFCSLICVQLLKDAGLPDDVIQIVIIRSCRRIRHCRRVRLPDVHRIDENRPAPGRTMGRRLVGYSAELGGKNPMIITGDTDARRRRHAP